jgi:sec-independent protein translocase protein TatA
MSTSTALFLIGGLGTQEILLIAVVALVLFGGKKIPELAKGLGEGIRNFKQSVKEEDKKAEDKKAEDKKAETAKQA